MKHLRKESIMCFKTKVSLLMLALFVGAGVFSMSVQPVQAASFADLQQIIQELKAQIIALQERLASVKQGQEDPGKWCHAFHRNLRYGNAGIEVKALQTALEKEGLYEPGKDASGKFGMYTSSAVVAFQERYVNEILAVYGLTHGTGFVGKTTRAKLNELYPCGITQVKPVIPEFVEPEEECNTKCQAQGYDKGICRKWVVVPSAEWGCKDGELDIGRTSDCTLPEGLVGVDKTCCCQKEAEEDCAKEGESVPVVPGALECCERLSKISCAKPDINGNCPEGCEGAFICANCGNGKCGLGENKCNCPEDCDEETNLPPVIDGLTAPTQLQVNEKGVWTIKAQDPENGALSYSVNWGDEYAKTTSPESAPAGLDTGVQTTTFTHSYSEAGTYTIRFIVTDDNKQTAKTSTTIKIGGSGITCTDSDGGQNKYVKGRTCRDLYTLDSSSSDPTATSSFGRFCRTDRCVSSGVSIYPFQDFSIEESISKNYLKEYYCGKNGKIFSKIIQCENGCEDGACKREVVEPTCTDSDHGRDYYKRGGISDGIRLPIPDYCVKDMSSDLAKEKKLDEYYCYGNKINSEIFECPNGCEDGACVIGAEPYCTAIGSRSEGWYQNGKLIKWNNCDGCYAICMYLDTDSEGWYSSCDNKLIKYANCGQDQEEPSITVTSPDGGETWTIGGTYDITWTCPGGAGADMVDIFLKDKRVGAEEQIGNLIDCSIEKYSWKIGDISPGENFFKIQLRHIAGGQPLIDESDDYFSIVEKLCGDVNCDGSVTEDDSTLLLNYITYGAEQYPICSEWAADVNCDGSITTSDGTRIAKYVNDHIGHPLECCQQ